MKILIKMMMMMLKVGLDINLNKIKRPFSWEVREENRYQIE